MYPTARAQANLPPSWSPVGIKTWETTMNADTLVTAVVVNNKLPVTSDPGVLCLLSIYMKLQQTNWVYLQVG